MNYDNFIVFRGQNNLFSVKIVHSILVVEPRILKSVFLISLVEPEKKEKTGVS